MAKKLPPMHPGEAGRISDRPVQRRHQFRRYHTVTSNPDGTSFVADGKIDYLLDGGISRLGPIGGLTYGRATVNG